jgi:type IV secretory pathway VirJ component
MKHFLLPAMAAAVLALSTPAAADAANLVKRQARQQARIAQGVNQGELSRAEAVRLQKSQSRINRSIRRDRADGPGLTTAERAKANARLDQQSLRIHRARNN